jgi:hypothetical protein
VDCVLDRSLKDSSTIFFFEDKSRLITFERLADGGYFKNNRQVIVRFCSPPIHGFLRVIRSMTHLEKLSLLYGRLSLTQHLPQLFRSCPKLTQLHLGLYERQKSKVNEVLKNELRSGFQRLRLFVLELGIYSCSLIQEILT